jgi:hypothetical protein
VRTWPKSLRCWRSAAMGMRTHQAFTSLMRIPGSGAALGGGTGAVPAESAAGTYFFFFFGIFLPISGRIVSAVIRI